MRIMIKSLVLIMACALIAGKAQAVVIAEYTFSSGKDGTGVSTDSHANSSAGSITDVGFGGGTKIANNHYFLKGGGADLGTTGMNTSRYLSFTISSISPTVTLNSLTFNLNATSAGTINWAVRSSADSFAANVSSGSMSAASPTLQTATFGLNSGSSIGFRLYYWNGVTSGGPDGIVDDITLNASVAPVPEPVNTALMIFCGTMGVVGCVRMYGKKKTVPSA